MKIEETNSLIKNEQYIVKLKEDFPFSKVDIVAVVYHKIRIGDINEILLQQLGDNLAYFVEIDKVNWIAPYTIEVYHELKKIRYLENKIRDMQDDVLRKTLPSFNIYDKFMG